MVEPISLQQILSMGTQVEKTQHVHQNLHDVSVQNIAQDTLSTLDEKKIEVPAQEQGSEINPADDQSRQKANQERKSKQRKEQSRQKTEEIKPGGNIEYGNRINIVV